MAYFPEIPMTRTSTLMTQQFLGLNKGLSIEDGEFADMQNMTADAFPVLSTRAQRTYVKWRDAEDGHVCSDPQGLVGTDRLIVCDRGKVYMDGEPIDGLSLSTEPEMQPKRIVCMGAYVCIWPDKVYFNTANPDEYGAMGSSWAPEGQTVTASMCRKDGTDYDETSIVKAAAAPESPTDGMLWLDTSGSNDVLKQYSSLSSAWTQVASTYIKIQSTGIGKGLKEGDAAFISGAVVTGGVASAPATASEGGEASEPAAAAVEESTISLPTSEFRLTSTFNTSLGTDGRINATTPTKPDRTKAFTVSGIPAGAVVKSSTLSFDAGSPKYGMKIFTVNGVKANVGQNVLDAGVTGNGDYSYKFVFQPYTGGATTVGARSSTVLVQNIVLTVVYTIETPEPEEPDTDPDNPDTPDTDSTFRDTVYAQIEALNTTNHLYGAGDDYIIVAGLLSNSVTLNSSIKVEMRVPDFDYVCEANNRIWGCSFSKATGELVNEIRACALGDFRNWYLFEGTSMDSYAVSVGSDGAFTGAFSLKGNPLFFKESVMHRISGNQPSNFSLNSVQCRGVQEGCWRSMTQVEEVLYYKARSDIMAYDGSVPYSISDKLGDLRYFDAAGGAARNKYYLSMCDEQQRWSLFVFDTKRGLWHREDSSQVQFFATVNGELYYIISGEPSVLVSASKVAGKQEEAFDWSVTFGVFGYELETQKYLSRFNIRAQLFAGSSMKMEIMYDSDGEWCDEGTVRCNTLRTFMLPVAPRRCDHCQVRISGHGQARIYSVARILEVGGDG